MADSPVAAEVDSHVASDVVTAAARSAFLSTWRFAGAVGLFMTLAQLGLAMVVGVLLNGKSPLEAYAGLSEWDTHWYGSIVTNGYRCTEPLLYDPRSTPCNVAFFPGYPALGWLLTQLGLPVEAALLLAAQLCC